mgnify:CR=1 FL=1
MNDHMSHPSHGHTNKDVKTAYFDCFSGASGDMILGAMLDAGLQLDDLKKELDKLHLSHFDLDAEKVTKRGIGGTRARVNIDQDYHDHHHRGLADILGILEKSDLETDIRDKCASIFKRIAEAEARVHRQPIEAVHFHEVGAMDSIIDVVGAVAGLTILGVQAIFCSPLHVGTGTVRCAHGIIPVPAPATAELIKGFPAYTTDVSGELLTPTGAAILTTLSSGFGPIPMMTVESIGYGAGKADPDIPNLLRIWICQKENQKDKEQTRLLH